MHRNDGVPPTGTTSSRSSVAPSFSTALRDLVLPGLTWNQTVRTHLNAWASMRSFISRFVPLPCDGTYFQLLDFSAISHASDVEFADTLLREVGVASIPISPFYATPPKLSVLRFCFAKNDSTLEEAAERLCRI